MKIEQFQLRGNNSMYAGAFQLMRGRAPARLRGNIGRNVYLQKPHKVLWSRLILFV
jgi:hypothetical protein